MTSEDVEVMYTVHQARPGTDANGGSRSRHSRLAARWAWIPLILAQGCGPTVYHPSIHPPSDLPASTPQLPFLKAHLYSGGVVLFEGWSSPLSGDSLLVGTGARYDVDRQLVERGRIAVHADSIALLEANSRETVSEFALAGLTVWTVLATATTAACLADPKSCFGSCPTFYLADDPEGAPVAEGFSSSWASVLEEGDVDALGVRVTGGSEFSLHMRNEAWETHAVRRLRLWAAPVSPGSTVLQAVDGTLYEARELLTATECSSAAGPCARQVRARDLDELRIWTDSSDLTRRTEVLVTLPVASGPSGIVLSARHSFVTTYVFYQSLAFAGTHAGELMARLERGDPLVKDRILAPIQALGPIEIEISEGDGGWRRIGGFGEAGPIATNRIVVPFEATGTGQLHVRLRMAQGSWRIDEVALASLTGAVAPVVLDPAEVLADGPDADARRRLADPDRYLITVPGDHYELRFRFPEDDSTYEVFLESRGYYYEWMRQAWLVEENPSLAMTMLANPRAGLRMLAPSFKSVEKDMDDLFWASRFRR